MIGYLRGEVAAVSEGKLILDVHDVGFMISVTSKDASLMPSAGNEVKIYTHLQVKEDDMQLYGFLTQDDLETFRLLLNVNGIGPKCIFQAHLVLQLQNQLLGSLVPYARSS